MPHSYWTETAPSVLVGVKLMGLKPGASVKPEGPLQTTRTHDASHRVLDLKMDRYTQDRIRTI